MSFFHEGFEKPRSLLRVMVAIKMINKIFILLTTKSPLRTFNSFWMFWVTDENVGEVGGKG